ncbi:C4-dicarboxylate TRAP transporter substrate-binding protein [Sporosarcina sp. 179-K 3D1 HS]|uniref:C4-dicarboxylate TRAP transporter substrate-binding protein n=1 Tax=Sporosarcina sp. 179-K 3D1 HS TaxID=3232169 RepID=UPI0039A306F5
MKRTYLQFVIILTLLVLVMVGCSDSNKASSEGADEKLKLRMGYVMAEGSPTHQSAKQFAENVAERTNGMIEIELFPNSTLGSDADVLEQAKLGTPVIAYNNPSGLQDMAPDLSVLGGPFLVEDWNQLQKVINSDFMEEQEALLQEKGLRVLAFNWYFGGRHVISDRVVEIPEDLKGAKVRSSPLPMWQETIKAMGANPTSLEWAEVYPGLEQGIIVGAEAPLETLYSSKIHEVADHISLTGHFKQVNGWLMSEDVFSSLPEEYQKILLEEAVAAGELATQTTIDKENEYEQKLKDEGVTITQPDVNAFKDATSGVYDILSENWSEGTYERVKEIIGN